MKKGINKFLVASLVFFIAGFTLIFIFDSLNKLAEKCNKGEELEICKQMQGLSMSLIIILLLISGLILVINVVAYLLISAQ
jgi:hypothetical protein